ncbi:putative immunodominant surface protein gp36 [Ehrlichia chaffeensis str. Liberty]|uniref:tandem repeat protein effector TRP47 n=1 Tax=Ehrlichia chaffeensis TaxID=945 RepID=UPI000444C219|nr:tandem repeat protein effector TRP47 [Ehrlichia chaffeensis]AHX05974.1 putative immunodominant surface protein gp36 [Ehrlichia chaffeensis str. Jax]AHX06964.1 putative immunodominant surface protein gp36 [Ehrlichia chaffeensis str. Liberty]
MLHLTTEIDNIDFSNNLNIHSGNRFVVTSGDMQVDVGSDPDHGYHLLFKNNGHVISDFHGVQAENFVFDVKNHNLRASFLVDVMAPFTELDSSQHPHFSVNMHTANECNSDCVYHNEHDHDAHGRGAASSVAEGVGSAIGQILSVSDSIVVPVLEGNASEPVVSQEAAPVSESGDAANPVSSSENASEGNASEPVVNQETAPVSESGDAANPVSSSENASEGNASEPVVNQEAAPVSESGDAANPVSSSENASEGNASEPVVNQETAPVSESGDAANPVSSSENASEGNASEPVVNQETAPAIQPQSRNSLLSEEDITAQFGNKYFYF